MSGSLKTIPLRMGLMYFIAGVFLDGGGGGRLFDGGGGGGG